MVHGGPIEPELIAQWRQDKAESMKRRAEYRTHAVKVLRSKNISFQERNRGAHLIVAYGGAQWDFWPGTGLFRKRPQGASCMFGASRDSTGRGIANLLRTMGVP